eukprot:TRINITY_DN129_c0_g1_i4.p1 TRINITY_DN129_c0_g1~~TRINITY_DN129_c0_g1_i4.p1  ORF type:complete len:249 (+),score=56.80 TRINITY_DN129_c0_g1_i4:409-1155(+)
MGFHTNAFLLLCFLTQVESFHFFLTPGHYHCYVEELVSQRSIVHIAYEAGSGIEENPVQIEVITPRGVTIYSEMIKRTSGSYQVTTQGVDGPHSVCLVGKGTGPMKLSLDIETHTTGTGDWQEHTDPASGRKFYHNPNTRESLWELPTDVNKALSVKNVKANSDEVLQTTKEEMEIYANYMKALQALMLQIKEEGSYIVDRQNKFRSTTDSTADAVWYISLFQVLICFALPAIQTFQMKRLFVQKKLV